MQLARFPSAARASAVLAALAALLVLAAPARADVSVTSFSVKPSTTAAGGHPDLTLSASFSYSGGDALKSLVFHFPPGLVGNPQATRHCSRADFQADACPSDTQVGTTTVVATVLGVPMSSDGSVYNLVPDPGQPALLGIVVRSSAGKIFLTSAVTIRTTTDFGIDSTVDNMPRDANGVPITIDSMSLTLRGTAGNPPAAFMSNPTGCGSARTVIEAVSYDAPQKRATASDAFTPTACDRLAFAPRVTATLGAPGLTKAGSHPPLVTTVSQGRGQAASSSAAVTLPAGLGTNVDALSVLCNPNQLTGACPPASQIGSGEIVSPLLPAPLKGPVYAVAVPGASLPGVAVVLNGTISFTLRGSSGVAPSGQLQTSFTGLPDVPLSSFQLTVNGGPRGLLTAGSDLCSERPPAVAGAFTGHNGASASVTTPVALAGCRPSARAAGRGFAGAHPRLSLSVLHANGGPPLRKVIATLPPELRVKRSRGVSVRASAALPRHAWRLSRRGTFSIALPGTGRARANATLARGSIAASPRLVRRLRSPRSVTLRLRIRIVDVTGHATALRVRMRARR